MNGLIRYLSKDWDKLRGDPLRLRRILKEVSSRGFGHDRDDAIAAGIKNSLLAWVL